MEEGEADAVSAAARRGCRESQNGGGEQQEIASVMHEVSALRDKLIGEDAAENSSPQQHDALNVATRLVTWRAEDIAATIRRACEMSYALTKHSAHTEEANAAGVQRAPADDAPSGTHTHTAKATLTRCLEALYYLHQTSFALAQSARALRALKRGGADAAEDTPSPRTDETLATGVARFAGVDPEAEITPAQQLILYFLNVVYARGYCRCGEDCYERRVTPDGADTRAWTRVCSIGELLDDVTRKELNFDQWRNRHRPGSSKMVLDYMMNCSDAQFPAFAKDRHVFAFRNGLYVASMDHVANPTPATGQFVAPALRDAFYAHGSPEIDAVLPRNVSAAKYFDEDFPCDVYAALNATASDRENADAENDDDAWYAAIPTPHLQSILDYQRFEPAVCKWAYIFIGRLIYAMKEADRWEVIPYLKGQASSGKSTLLMHVCRNLYDLADVGILSNNIERKFGISAFSGKYLFVAPEIKSDLQMEQAEFQSMVSGEALQMATKYQTARTVDWRVPGVMAGNEVPAWVDNAGSIGRRIVVFEFMRKVVHGDTNLGRKLDAEMPRIILKCNRAYHAAVRRVGTDSVWCHLPEYFRRTKEELTEASNPVQHFMSSGKLAYHDPDAYMPFDTLKRAFQGHCEENNYARVSLSLDKFIPVMLEFGIQLERNRTPVPRQYPRTPGSPFVAKREWCIGTDFAPADVAMHDAAAAAPTGARQGGGDDEEDPFRHSGRMFFA